VRYSVNRRIAGGQPDYFDHATMLELAVLSSDSAAAVHHAADAMAAAREVWELDTTLGNLRLIHSARGDRGEPTDWMDQIETAIESRMADLSGHR
jgi:hypothetical protein